VADAVATFQHDLLTRNWQDICERVFSSDARAQAGGDSCPSYVRSGAAGLRGERIKINAILVQRGGASVDVTTTAVGQAPVADTLQLVLEDGRYRVSRLAQ
jgi:hypothetical protein